MKNGIHFISGLPRSGSTLLAALLAQNPKLHANMSSPVASLFTSLLRELSAGNEGAVFIDDGQREAVLRGMFDNFYHDVHPVKTVFDTSRLWCTKTSAIAGLFPDAKIICCVRDVSWVMDSVERLIRKNRFQPSKIFDFETGGTTFSRVEGLAAPGGLVGFAWHALKQAYYGEEADRLLLVTYDTLVGSPKHALDAIYRFCDLPAFAHDFENVQFDAKEFDERLGTPGLHDVRPRVALTRRETILPPDLFARFDGDSFWKNPTLNTKGVRIV